MKQRVETPENGCLENDELSFLGWRNLAGANCLFQGCPFSPQPPTPQKQQQNQSPKSPTQNVFWAFGPSNELRKKPYYFPLYSLVNRDPYNGLL